jgi:hypothetical protein
MESRLLNGRIIPSYNKRAQPDCLYFSFNIFSLLLRARENHQDI